MSKAVTFLCPNCRSKIKTGEPIGTGINVRACGECDHTYYVQALDETHCRMSIAASRTRVGYQREETINPNFKKGGFTYSGGGRSAGKAYKAAKDFYTKFTKDNPDMVEDAEFEDVSEGEYYNPIVYGFNTDFFKEAEGEPADTQEEDTGNKGFWIGMDFGKEDRQGYGLFMPADRSFEPTEKIDTEKHKVVFDDPEFDREALLNGKWAKAEINFQSNEDLQEKLRQLADRLREATEKLTRNKPRKDTYKEELVKHYQGRGASLEDAIKAADSTIELHKKQGVPTPKLRRKKNS